MDDNSETTPISFPEDLGDKHCAKVVSVFGVFLVRFLPHSNQKNSEYGYFSRSKEKRIFIVFFITGYRGINMRRSLYNYKV